MTWLTGWNRRKPITVTGSTSGAQSDYQMRLTVNQASGTDSAGIVNLGGNVLTTFNDLRFTKSDGSTLLNYWIEFIIGTTPNQVATVWIKLAPYPDTIPTSPSTYNFYIYYNNTGASATNNGTNTFTLFDDFNGASLDTAKWGISGSTGSSVSGGLLNTQGTAEGMLYSKNYSITSGEMYLFRFKVGGTGYAAANFVLGQKTAYTTDAYLDVLNNGALYYYSGGWTPDGSHTTYAPATNDIVDVIFTIGSTGFSVLKNGVSLYNKTTTRPISSNGIGFRTYNANEYIIIDYLFIRKYTSPEPTFSVSGSEEPSITAYSMYLTPSETPCRTGICTVRADVIWQNLGSSSVTFRPKILIDGVTYAQAASDTTINPYPSMSSTIQITTPTLSTGTHSICLYPN